MLIFDTKCSLADTSDALPGVREGGTNIIILLCFARTTKFPPTPNRFFRKGFMVVVGYNLGQSYLDMRRWIHEWKEGKTNSVLQCYSVLKFTTVYTTVVHCGTLWHTVAHCGTM